MFQFRILTDMMIPSLYSLLSVIGTAVLGAAIYLVIYWIRLGEINKKRGQDEQLTLRQLVENDWKIVIASVRGKEEEEKNLEETPNKKDKSKPAMRRTGSSGDLNNMTLRKRPSLKKQPSMSNVSPTGSRKYMKED